MSKENRILSYTPVWTLQLVLLFCFVKWYYLVSLRSLWTVDYWLKHGCEACYINCRYCYKILRHPKYPAVFVACSLGTLHALQLLQHDPEANYINSAYCNMVLRHFTYPAVIATLSWGMLHLCSYWQLLQHCHTYCNIFLRHTTYPTVTVTLSWETQHILQFSQNCPEEHYIPCSYCNMVLRHIQLLMLTCTW